jgi:hypothetical protein
MRLYTNMRVILTALGVVAAMANLGCSSDPNAFQPITFGAKPWTPPPGWDPEPPCAVGYFVAIDSCSGCTGISYALCVGDRFSQCVCGGPATPATTCPQMLACDANDFPPINWTEFTLYAGPGWAGRNRAGDGG